MIVKELKADYLGHQIAVRNSWGPAMSLKALTTELRLYVDGKVMDTNEEAFSYSSRAAVLRGAIEEGGRNHVIEIYARSIMRTKMKICVDGVKIAGDLP